MEKEQESLSGLISANVWLGGRSYRIRIRPDEEEAVRKAVKLADDKVVEMRRHYAGKDDQDFVAMVLITYATEAATSRNEDPLLRQSLRDMQERINQALDGAE